MKKLLLPTLLPLMLLLSSCAGILDQHRHKGGSVIILSAIPFNAIENQYATPAQSKHFKVTNAGFIVQGSRSRNFYANEVVATVDMDLKEAFQQDVYQEVVFENPANPSQPIIFTAPFIKSDNKRSLLVSNHLKDLKMDQEYKIQINFYTDKSKKQLLEGITQIIRSPYDTQGGCVKTNLPKEILSKMPLVDTNHICVKI